MDERLPSSFIGYFFGGLDSPSSQGLGLIVNVGLGVPQFSERSQVDTRLWTNAKLEMIIDLWEDKHRGIVGKPWLQKIGRNLQTK